MSLVLPGRQLLRVRVAVGIYRIPSCFHLELWNICACFLCAQMLAMASCPFYKPYWAVPETAYFDQSWPLSMRGRLRWQGYFELNARLLRRIGWSFRVTSSWLRAFSPRPRLPAVTWVDITLSGSMIYAALDLLIFSQTITIICPRERSGGGQAVR